MNILFLVWDACRVDAVSEAPTFQQLCDENLWYSKAVAPSSWSLPSHVSILDGSYPHEHQVARAYDCPDGLTLCDSLANDGYRRYCISANSFISPSHDIDEYFDEYYFTIARKFARGQSLSDYYNQFQQIQDAIDQREFKPAVETGTKVLFDVLRNPDRMHSVANFIGGSLQTFTSGRSTPLNRIPHPMFNSTNPFGFSAELNTELIQDAIATHASTDEPFFIFSNYFNTHRPYNPPAKYQREYLGRELDYREIDRLDDTIAQPWKFHEWEQSTSDESDLETIRKLYRGEVRAVDEELKTILRTLEEHGQRENTLVVITADHGETLGERGPLGWRSMGHVGSVSDHLLTVPLLIAHPDLPSLDYHDPVTLTDLPQLLTTERDSLFEQMQSNPLQTQVAGCEIPPRGTDVLYDRYPFAPTERIEEDVNSFTVVGYMDEWKYMHSSTGTKAAWKGENETDLDAVPEPLVTWVDDRLSDISREDRQELSEDARTHLEQLGYI